MAKQKTMLEEQVDHVVRMEFASKDEVPEEGEVREAYEKYYDALSSVCPDEGGNREESIEALVKQYCSELQITKRLGFAYKDDDSKPWLGDAEEEISERNGWFYWGRYKNYLLNTKQWANASVQSVEKDTYRILDLMADPEADAPFERRGLVVASVQSGKTANYIGLITRAADVGYKIIIVMAGVYNVLRSQTQARIEEGFTGFNIDNDHRIPVGVGLEDQSHTPIACTSREADFNKGRADALRAIQTTHTDETLLFVIKKNSNSLKRVYEWLEDNASREDPLLLIDDEADNASINVKYKRGRSEEEPTRINGQIRNILNYFYKKCYVGYTATPYANILIDPNVDNDKYRKDLFPSSFIYTLEESSDYFGASKVFSDLDETHPKHLRFIRDIDLILPPKHKSSYRVTEIPNSLKKAVRTFILATAIRSLRGDGDEHSSMMVNVSPYRAPQNSVKSLIQDYLDELRCSINAYSDLESDLALKSSGSLRDIHQTWCEEYSDPDEYEFDWEQVQGALNDAVKTMHVVSINSSSNDFLDYENQTEHVIAVGGYRLSRGLTLEGLVVSYYSRNAKAYDALMQMARWFGYRSGYEDLCRIWMSRQTAGWYKFVADSTDDLFDELRFMTQIKRTPRNYGLKIRQSPDSLIVTARNKMGTGTKVKAPTDLNNGFVETVAFKRDPEVIAHNKSVTAKLLEDIASHRFQDGADDVAGSGGLFYRNVPVEAVENFLRAYDNEDVKSPKTQKEPILDYISGRLIDDELKEWDVYVAQGEGEEVPLSDSVSAKPEIRYPGADTTADCLVVGDKHRLASPGAERVGLGVAERQRAESAFKRDHPDKKNTSGLYYRRQRIYPLLVIHPVSMGFEGKREASGDEELLAMCWERGSSELAYGWSISFPYTDKQAALVDYVFNEVAINSINAEYEEDSDDDYADEE